MRLVVPKKRILKKLQKSFLQDDNVLRRKITELIPGLVAVYNVNTGKYIYINSSSKRVLGYKIDDWLDKGVQYVASLIHPDDSVQLLKRNVKALKTANRKGYPTTGDDPIISFEYRMRHKNGTWRWLKTDGVVFARDANGKVEYVMNISVDITERKEAELRSLKKKALIEKDLSESIERLRLALEAGKIGVWDWDIKRNKIIWSKRVYDFYDADPETFEVNYQNFEKLIYPDDKKMTDEAIKDAVDGRKEYDIAYRIKTLCGRIRWISSRAIVERDLDGKPVRMLGATSDVTEQKRAEQDKDDFISIAAHELKTPLTSLKAYTQVLKKRFTKSQDEQTTNQLSKMDRQIDKLATLVSDLLDVTKIESGKLQMQLDYFNFDELAHEIAEELQRTTERHKITIRGYTKKKIYADRERTGQVITNFLTNAIKYSPDSEKILIQLSLKRENVQLCVKDYGVGIPTEKQKDVFERFYRVTGPKEITFPGLGLGLYICSEIINRQNGKIWVRSKPNQGSRFCFTLPIKGNKTN